MKKAQVSLYAIIGLIAVIAVSTFLLLMLSSQREEIQSSGSSGFSESSASLKAYVEECLKASAMKAIEKFGLKESGDAEAFKNKGNFINPL